MGGPICSTSDHLPYVTYPMMPAENEKDLMEIRDDLNVDLEFRFVSVIEDVLKLARGEHLDKDGKAKKK